MNKLNFEEFKDRIEALERARKIFIGSGITNNITTAFKIYQEVLAEKERREVLSTKEDGNRSRSPFDIYERPKCSQCGMEMGLRVINIPQGVKNVNGYKTCWECYNCAHEEYSYKTIEGWMKELNVKPSYGGK